jgi:hypothetical protein
MALSMMPAALTARVPPLRLMAPPPRLASDATLRTPLTYVVVPE